jgi:hypothetical protein
MKRTFLVALIAFFTIHLFAQTDKGKFIFSIEGNYQKTASENGTFINKTSAQTKAADVGILIGYFITERFVVGFGLDYFSVNETRTSLLALDKYFEMEEQKIKLSTFAPSIHFNYYLPVLPKLFISSKLKFSYGKINSDMSSARSSMWPYETSNVTESFPYSGSSGTIDNPEFFNARFSPEVTWFFSSKWGFYLGLGGLEYSITQWNADNSSFIINFNPSKWRLGVTFKI